ncbi:prevent-host-death protein [Chryseobacterium sp. SIMBA_029]|uniref:prevent-host-death protein n=1 Tax=Chryseobacterium sp. SIMBA_029 TaxID=3085772 RepID=UPI003979DF55
MNYTLELKTQESYSNVIFNTIIFDSFKVNIVERYTGRMNFNPKLSYALFKVRTPENDIIRTRDDNGRVKIKGNHFDTYTKLTDVLKSYDYKNKLINRQEAQRDYVHFILSLVIVNYEIN